MEDLPSRGRIGDMLTLEAYSRGVAAKTAAAAAEPPPSSSSSSSLSSLPPHLTTSSHQGLPPARRQLPPYHFKPQQLFLEDTCPGAMMKRPLPSLQYKVQDSAFCRVLSADTTAAALAASAAVCSASLDRDVWKCGYLRKQKHGHKRFFVLRGPSHLGPSRLEYYDSEKKFRSGLKAAAAAGTGTGSGGVVCPAKRVIYLSQCFTVNKRADAKNKYLIALYTKDEYFAMVAENEQEQGDWYLALNDLMTEGKKGQLDADELDDGYGTISPGTIFKEVWQVNVKPKGLGQTKNLMGVYRLCLSAKTIHLVKLNSETPSVNLPLMNIRRCGHSESFFFIEVGRSSSIGPGEIWVQVEDSVVAQNMHETILDTMRALKAFPDFRPRSKSQSSGSNPVPFITTRRHLGNLPPSQTGLQRHSRTDSVTGTPPGGKGKGGRERFRTSSEGEGTSGRPLSSGTGSLVHLNTPCANVGREESAGSCCARSSPSSSHHHHHHHHQQHHHHHHHHHARSASLPVTHFLSATSPISVSSSSGHGSASDTHTRPSSSSICGSPSDGGFNSSDEFCSSPCDFRYFRANSNTPESLGNTPPVREEHRLMDCMALDRQHTFEEESCYMERAFIKLALSSKAKFACGGGGGGVTHQKATQTTSSLDESSPVEARRHVACACSPKSCYRSYVELHHPAKPSALHADSQKKLVKDDGYMPMMYSVASSPSTNYIPMQPKLLHPSTLEVQCPLAGSAQQAGPSGYMMMMPGDGLPCGRSQADDCSEYMEMTLSNVTEVYPQTPPDAPRSGGSYFSLPRSYKAPLREKSGRGEYTVTTPADSPSPPSPGEYIHMDFGDRLTRSPVSPPDACAAGFEPYCPALEQEYLDLDMDSLLFKGRPPRHSLVAPWNPPNYARPVASAYIQADCDPEKTFVGCGVAKSPSQLFQHLCVVESSPTEPAVVRADPQGRRRHSSETFSPPLAPGRVSCSTNPNLPEGSRWHDSASFSSVWSQTEDPSFPDSTATPAGRRNTSSSYLNYVALDLKEVPGSASRGAAPRPARNRGDESEAYTGIDFSVPGGSTTASKD